MGYVLRIQIIFVVLYASASSLMALPVENNNSLIASSMTNNNSSMVLPAENNNSSMASSRTNNNSSITPSGENSNSSTPITPSGGNNNSSTPSSGQDNSTVICVKDCTPICMNLDSATSSECESACQKGCQPMLARKAGSLSNFNSSDFILSYVNRGD